MAKVNCYIDGFNLYYGLYKNTKRQHNLRRYKWLGLRAMADRLAGSNDYVEDVYYCTADVVSPQHDPDQGARQQVFLNALVAHSNVIVVKGQFKIREKIGMPVDETTYGSRPISVQVFEEKGTDVNLATLLVRDAFLGAFDRTIVVSNDTDLKLAIDTAVQIAGKQVHVVSPGLWVANELQAVASRNGVLSPRIVMQCQLPDPVIDSDDKHFQKPSRWR